MMEQEWKGILARFGQAVTLWKNGENHSLRAFVQPAMDRGRDQEVPGPLGLGRQDRFLYLGPSDHPVDLDTVVEWKGREYRVQSAHLMGEGVCPYWWAMLYPRDEVAV